MDSWEAEVAAVPGVRLRPFTESRALALLRCCGWSMSAMTLGRTVWMDPGIIGTAYGGQVLRHEAVHVRDQARWGLLFFITYFLPPIGPSFRALWEARAYRETLRSIVSEFPWQRDWAVEWVTSRFTGPSYGFMFPFPSIVRRWCRRVVDEAGAPPADALDDDV